MTLVGLVTGGDGICGVPGKPNYFARITAKRDWILQNSDACEWQSNGIVALSELVAIKIIGLLK